MIKKVKMNLNVFKFARRLCALVLVHLYHYHIQYIYNTYTIHIQYIYNTYTIHIQYIYNTYTIHIQYIYNTYTIHIQYIYNTYTIHIQYIYNTYTILYFRITYKNVVIKTKETQRLALYQGSPKEKKYKII